MAERFFFLVLAAVLAGCGGAPAGDTLFPLGDGHVWRYRLTTTIDDVADAPRHETLTLSTRGAENFDGHPAWRRHSDSGIDYWLRSDDTGIYRVASKGPLDVEPTGDNPPRYVLRKPYAVGTQWEVLTTTYVLQRKNEVPREIRHTQKPFPMVYRIEAIDQKVETAAGRYEGCVRVAGKAQIRLYVDAMFAWREVPLTATEWYCPQVGLVKVERSEPSPTKFMLGGTVTMELASWK